MRKSLAVLILAAAVLAFEAAPALALCSSQSICDQFGRCTFCTTCCTGTFCNTMCT